MKFPRFKKSSVRAVIRDWTIDIEPDADTPYRCELTYGLNGDAYSYTFVFKYPGHKHREIFMDCNQCNYADMLNAYKYFIKWAKRTQRAWEKEARNDEPQRGV